MDNMGFVSIPFLGEIAWKDKKNIDENGTSYCDCGKVYRKKCGKNIAP